MAVPAYPMAPPAQIAPGVAGPLAPPLTGPQFTHIPAAPFASPMPFTSPVAPTMTMMPSFIPPGFPTQMPWQMPAATGPFQGPAPGVMGFPAVQGMPPAAMQGNPWGARPVNAAPTQLSATVPGVTSAPVAGISPGGFPPPTMPGFPVPGGAVPGFPNLQMNPAPTQQTAQGVPGAGFGPVAAAQGFPKATPAGTVQGFPSAPAGQGFPAAAPAGTVQGFPVAAPAGTVQGFPFAAPDSQRLAFAILQQPAFQATLGGWANAWLNSPEFKARLVDVLKAPDLQETLRKNAQGMMQDTAFLQEVAKRVSEQAKG